MSSVYSFLFSFYFATQVTLPKLKFYLASVLCVCNRMSLLILFFFYTIPRGRLVTSYVEYIFQYLFSRSDIYNKTRVNTKNQK